MQLHFLAPVDFFKAVKRLQFFTRVDFFFDSQFSRARFVMSTQQEGNIQPLWKVASLIEHHGRYVFQTACFMRNEQKRDTDMYILAQAILAQAISCSNVRLLARLASFAISLLHPVKTSPDAAQGWSTLEVPAGWLQVIRGPRPLAVQWPKASRGQGQVRKPPVPSKKVNKKQIERKVPGSENRRGPPQVSPAAQDRVLRLQTAVNALGDDDSPEAKMLRDALKKAQQEVTTAPVGVRLDACAQFVERAKNRLFKADEALRKAQDERCKLEQELREGQQRLEELRAEAFEQVRAPPAAPAAGDEVSNLKKLVSELRGQVAVLEENRHNNWERCRGVEEVASRGGGPSTFPERSQDFRVVNRIGNSRINESFCPYGISDRCKRRQAQMCRIHGSLMVWADRSCRYGLRGIRVGEASNPGPSSNEYGRFTALSEEAAPTLVFQNVTQLDSPAPESVIEALHFDLRSDTESVRSGGPQDAVDSTGEEDDEWSVAGTEEVASEVEAEVEVGVTRHRSLQAALIALDHLNVEDTFKQRASVMKVVPKFLRGSYRNAMRVALEEITVDNPARRERGS